MTTEIQIFKSVVAKRLELPESMLYGTSLRLAEVVMRCPAGALHFRRLDGGPQEPESDGVSVRATTNGPLHVRGKVTILDQAGHVVREDTRMALCRCGASANKPFCDGSHARVRFRDRNGPV